MRRPPRHPAPRVLVRSVLVRLTEAEHQALTEDARDRACSVSHLVRCAITGVPTRSRPTPDRLDLDAVISLGRIGTNLNQATHLLHLRMQQGDDLAQPLADLATQVQAVCAQVGALQEALR